MNLEAKKTLNYNGPNATAAYGKTARMACCWLDDS